MHIYRAFIVIGLFFIFLVGCKPKQKPSDNYHLEMIAHPDTLYCEEILKYEVVVFYNDTLTLQDTMRLRRSFEVLNKKFKEAEIAFEISSLIPHNFPYLEDLTTDGYTPYINISKFLDRPIISLWVVDNNVAGLCTSLGCGRTGGFSFVANTITNNIVVTRIDLSNSHVVIHEFGHFFGLDHTFETDKYGVETEDCLNTGDRICDTPFDPGAIYEPFISYDECIMLYSNYNPMVNNLMAYYKPCKNKKYTFTPGQIERIRDVALTIHLNKATIYCE